MVHALIGGAGDLAAVGTIGSAVPGTIRSGKGTFGALAKSPGERQKHDLGRFVRIRNDRLRTVFSLMRAEEKNKSTFDKALSVSVIYYKVRIEMEVPRWAKLLPL